MNVAQVFAGGGQDIDRPAAGWVGGPRDDAGPLELAQARDEEAARDAGRAVSDLAEGCAPSSRFRKMSGVQRVARISAALAMGQYWPYDFTT